MTFIDRDMLGLVFDIERFYQKILVLTTFMRLVHFHFATPELHSGRAYNKTREEDRKTIDPTWTHIHRTSEEV